MKLLLILLSLLLCPLTLQAKELVDFSLQDILASQEEHVAREKAQSSSQMVLLSWAENPDSVRYEVEVFQSIPDGLDRNTAYDGALYRNKRIYTHHLLLDISSLPNEGRGLFWRVRPINAEWQPMGSFSSPQELISTTTPVDRNAPVALSEEKGTALLYPVYVYAGNPGATRYEVEVTSQYPENLDSVLPSHTRVFSKETSLSDVYDEEPRRGTFYWRVRGLDNDGNAVGVWSMPQKTGILPSPNVKIGVFGDSITQGGGRLYHSPAERAYSYCAYLDFPVINMGRSGDTVEMMEKRFDRDVLPFHVETLLIMGGINDLRMGKDPKDVISSLERIRKRAIDHGIQPILLTLPPINPDQIEKYYKEATAPQWREAVDEVNRYIKTVPHIDTAAPFAEFSVLPVDLAMDGLHEDWNGKQMIAGEINRNIGHFVNVSRETK